MAVVHLKAGQFLGNKSIYYVLKPEQNPYGA